MGSSRLTLAGLGLAMLALSGACSRPEVLTPEAAKARGDAMLRQMSDSLAKAQTFSYQADQAIDRIGAGGARTTQRFSRNTIVRRPNQVTFSDEGDLTGAAWYDGKQLTIVANRDKIWVRGPMPGTLDEAMDFISAEYDVQIPTADLLYSNPYEALMTTDTTGGWVGVEKVGERACDHLSYQQAVVDWQIWLTQDERKLPCQLQLTYKTQDGQPVSKIVFNQWNPGTPITDDTFKPVIPDGYRRIKLMRHATVEDPNVKDEPGDKK